MSSVLILPGSARLNFGQQPPAEKDEEGDEEDLTKMVKGDGVDGKKKGSMTTQLPPHNLPAA